MAAKDKRYYWLKLKRDFFKRHDIQIIEAMPNGKDYILFYLKLLCESVDHEGGLRFNDEIPYNEQMLATITNTNVDVVRSAIKLFADLKMMEIMDDGTYYMREVEKMIGGETYWAQKKREQREKAAALPAPEDSEDWTLSNDCPTCPSKSKSKREEIETEIETEIEGDTDTETEEPAAQAAAAPPVPFTEIKNLYNGICVSYSRVISLSTNRKKAIAARWKEYGRDLEIFRELFERAEASAFLKGVNDRNWSADFDWLMKSDNMAKVLEGRYDSQRRQQCSSSGGMSTLDVLQNIAAAEEARL